MTNINEQMPVVLKLIKPGGLLIAQGPLEANFNIFTMGVRLSRSLRPNSKSELAPYHVMLATKQGQEECFRRFDLVKQEIRSHRGNLAGACTPVTIRLGQATCDWSIRIATPFPGCFLNSVRVGQSIFLCWQDWLILWSAGARGVRHRFGLNLAVTDKQTKRRRRHFALPAHTQS